MDINDVEIIDRKTVYQGYFRMDLYRLRHRTFEGGWSGEIKREVFQRGHAVGVVLYDPERDMVVLTEQFRIGALAAGRHPWVVEIVAGIIDPGEAPEEVARRETKEEAGSELSDLTLIADYLVSPGCSSETVKLYCARVDSTNVGGVFGLKDEGEDIRVYAVPFEQVLTDLAAGRVETSLALIGLQWLALNRPALRARWATGATAGP